jgi:hypothetical protein
VTAAGLGPIFVTAMCEEPLERLVGIDKVAEIPVGLAAIGRPGSATESGSETRSRRWDQPRIEGSRPMGRMAARRRRALSGRASSVES